MAGPMPGSKGAWPGRVLALPTNARIFLCAALAGALLAPSACMVRSDRPVMGPDSTLVFPSRLPNDVNAAITFALRDSRAREEERQRDRERQRAISRLKKDRERLLDLAAAQEKERARQARLEAEKARRASEKAKAKAKKGKSNKGKKAADPKVARKKVPKKSDGGATRPKPDLFALSPLALRDSLASIDARLRRLAVDDSLAQLAAWKVRKARGLYEDERAFDLEEDARVLATVRLENVRARGDRPLTFHLVWLNPAQKRVFKKIYEYTPSDSARTLTGSFSIPPSRRTPGFYTLQVFLFRELIAQKSFELRGAGVEVPEGGSGAGM